MKNKGTEPKEIKSLFNKLLKCECKPFPKTHNTLIAPKDKGVYIVYKNRDVLHVGRTPSGRNGIYQRLKNHLSNASSFTYKYLNGQGSILRRKGYGFKCLPEKNARKRALLESYAIGMLCPKHIGLGKKQNIK